MARAVGENDMKELDDKVLAVITLNPLGVAFNAIRKYLPAEFTYRELDKSLQRLRRAGRIEYVKTTGWVAT